MTKISRTKIKREWTNPLPISLIMVMFMHYLTYKVLVIYSFTHFPNIYTTMDFWGMRNATSQSPIILILYIHILLIGYILVEAWSDWSLYPRYRNIIIYGLTLIMALQGVIGLDIISRFSPYNPQQINRTEFLQHAVLKNDLEEVKRLISNGYGPFDYSLGNAEIFDDYKWLYPAYWPTPIEWDRYEKSFFPDGPPSIFLYASANATANNSRNYVFWLREDYRHPRKQTILPFKPEIFNYLLALNPSKFQLQLAVSDLTWQGHATALIRILDHNKDLTPSVKDLSISLNRCSIDVSEILLERIFKNSKNSAETYSLLSNEFSDLETDYSPCNTPIQKHLNSEKFAIP